jgi:hypothetical protein
MQPRLRDLVERALAARHYSVRTHKSYHGWIARFVRYHRCHPRACGAAEIRQFLDALITRRRVSASTHQQALCAIVFSIATFSTSTHPGSASSSGPRVSRACPSS